MTRRSITHGDGTVHLDGDWCPFCLLTERVVERTPDRVAPYVLIEAIAVHAHGCPLTRIGKKFGLCSCGAAEMWGRHREAMVAIVHGRADQ